MKQVVTIGIASCLGGSETTCYKAPEVIKTSPFQNILSHQQIQLDWQEIIQQSFATDNKLKCIEAVNKKLAAYTEKYTTQKQAFLVISGEHSSAMGTWAGVQNALLPSSLNQSPQKRTLGLIWLDAHLDAHTLHSSHSGNIHGMPVTTLLGLSEPELLNCYPSSYYLAAENLLFYGVRNFESVESDRLNKHKVQFSFFNNTTKQKESFLTQVNELIRQCDFVGISLDLDVLDPDDAPAVETAVKNGIKTSDLLEILNHIKTRAKDKLIGLEVTEFNPVKDQHNKTEKIILAIIAEIFK